MKKILLSVLLIQLLSGCFLRHSTEIFTDKQISGDDFSIELARLYQGFVASEIDVRDWSDAKHFSQKGLRAAQGIEVDPEHPEDRDIPQTMLPTLIEARRALLDIITSKVIAEKPKLAAKAYFMYDCWIEEIEEWQDNNIAQCRDNFYDTLNIIQNPPELEKAEEKVLASAKSDGKKPSTAPAANNKKSQDVKSPTKRLDLSEEDKSITKEEQDFTGERSATFIDDIKELEPKPSSDSQLKPQGDVVIDAAVGAQNTFYVFFDENNSELTELANGVISKSINEIKSRSLYEVTILGYSSMAELELTPTLSDERSAIVYNKLIDSGIKQTNIEYYGFDDQENDDDGDEKSNRRVEIYVK